ncbi:DUF1499 domain-containing protein [Rhizobium halophytocola]|uniref:DUF1499 domain-containing protein n=1 Tax=Rhizobium halophytocola TaxID=735519 RepID=A0ABS4DX66_9HYPH|nr:DUF1499 domain-containing protein [Rhizobium halophytocola]MBP1850265.1 hypothetical protein [Rhizobium halophytocola]
MTIRYDRPVSNSALMAFRLAVFAASMIVLTVAAHRFGPLATPDFVALALVSAIPALIAVPLAVIGLMQLWQNGAEGGAAAGKALVFAALPLAFVGFGLARGLTLPTLYDVTSDTAAPPVFIVPVAANQKWLPRPPITLAQRAGQAEAYPGLTGRRYEGALDRVYEAVVTVADKTGWRIGATRGTEFALPEFPAEDEAADKNAAKADDDAPPDVGPIPLPRPLEQPAEIDPTVEPGVIRLQASTRTLFLGLPFDAMIRLREEAETTLVDVRVQSRYGPTDLGISAELAEDYLHALDAELLGIAGD